MNNNVFKETLNKGIPVATPVELLCSDLFELCTNKNRIQKIVNTEFMKYLNFIFKDLNSIDVEFFQSMMIATDSESLEKRICFSLAGFISSLYINLNVDNIYYQMSQGNKNSICENCQNIDSEFYMAFKEKIKTRTDLLKNIKKERVLKREFPALYKKYLEIESCNNNFIEISKMLENSEKYGLKEFEIRKLMYDSAKTKLKDEMSKNVLSNFNLDERIKEAKEFSLENFCKTYSETLSEIANRLLNIKEYLLTHPIDFSRISQIDKEKLSLYIANQFLFIAENADSKDKQRYVYYVTDYFSEDKSRKYNTDLKITCRQLKNEKLGIKSNGYSITPKSLYEKYKNLLLSNPSLHAIDFKDVDFSKMNLREVEEFMEEFLKELSANWEFLSQDDSIFEKEVLSKIKKTSNQENSEEEKHKKMQTLIDLYMEKKCFYDSTDPFFRIKGKNTFDGYVGYIYSNGKVVLDKYYENSTKGIVAKNEAIYVMNVDEFYNLSRLTKRELISNNLCRRIIHKGDWQSRVQNVIDLPGNFINTAKDVEHLVKEKKITGIQV